MYRPMKLGDHPNLSDLTVYYGNNEKLLVHRLMLVLRSDVFSTSYSGKFSDLTSDLDLTLFSSRSVLAFFSCIYENKFTSVEETDLSDLWELLSTYQVKFTDSISLFKVAADPEVYFKLTKGIEKFITIYGIPSYTDAIKGYIGDELVKRFNSNNNRIFGLNDKSLCRFILELDESVNVISRLRNVDKVFDINDIDGDVDVVKKLDIDSLSNIVAQCLLEENSFVNRMLCEAGRFEEVYKYCKDNFIVNVAIDSELICSDSMSKTDLVLYLAYGDGPVGPYPFNLIDAYDEINKYKHKYEYVRDTAIKHYILRKIEKYVDNSDDTMISEVFLSDTRVMFVSTSAVYADNNTTARKLFKNLTDMSMTRDYDRNLADKVRKLMPYGPYIHIHPGHYSNAVDDGRLSLHHIDSVLRFRGH